MHDWLTTSFEWAHRLESEGLLAICEVVWGGGSQQSVENSVKVSPRRFVSLWELEGSPVYLPPPRPASRSPSHSLHGAFSLLLEYSSSTTLSLESREPTRVTNSSRSQLHVFFFFYYFFFPIFSLSLSLFSTLVVRERIKISKFLHVFSPFLFFILLFFLLKINALPVESKRSLELMRENGKKSCGSL